MGSDHYWRVVTGRVERFTDTLCAVETIFGWVIQGVCANVNHRLSPRNISATALFLACSDNWCTEVLPGDPSDIWRLDAIGITDEQDHVSKHPALLHFRSTVRKSAGRYVVPLMIKTPALTSCTNRSVAETRLKRPQQRTGGRVPNCSLTASHTSTDITTGPREVQLTLQAPQSNRLDFEPSSSSQLHVGDLVVVRDDNVPTLQWKLGRVVEAFPGRDGLERSESFVVAASESRGDLRCADASAPQHPSSKRKACGAIVASTK
ncbi:hypothetical protein MTO96_008621 [Rhipicephalus appendiculatus]